MQILDPITSRDFSRGRIAKSTVATSLVPPNSVSNIINMDVAEIIGSAVMRKGNTVFKPVVASSTTGQSQTGGADVATHIFTDNWFGQTFTPAAGQTEILGFRFKLQRVLNPTSMTIRVFATTASLPNGLNQTTAVAYNPAGITAGAGGAVYDFPIQPIPVTPGTEYAVVLSVVGDAANYLIWVKNAAGGYAGGQAVFSVNAGGAWTADTGTDYYFAVLNATTVNTYNAAPLGFLMNVINSIDASAVIYFNSISGTAILYYYKVGPNSYVISDQQTLANLKARFTILNKNMFFSNTTDGMKSSSDGGATWTTANCITTDGVKPNLLYVSKNRMLASGFPTFKSRVYFSSIVDPNASTFITWNTDPDDGDWIDINPDDGGNITGFSDTSGIVLIFKDRAMYRLNAINKTVDTDNIFNVGAVTQEAITKCLGMTYFYSGNGIYRTDGSFPELISRIAVQDFIDVIPDATQVYLGTDGFNVYASIGTVTVPLGVNDVRILANVVLKFSPRDSSWSVHTYSVQQAMYGIFNNNGGIPKIFVSAQFNGDIGWINHPDDRVGDYLAEIPYELETQEQEFGNRAHSKQISDQFVVYMEKGGKSSFLIRENDGDFEPAQMTLNNAVNVATTLNFEANYFTFRLNGSAIGARPIFQGYHLPKVTDLGIIK